MAVFDDGTSAPELNVKVPLTGLLQIFEVFDRVGLLLGRSGGLQILTLAGLLLLLGSFLYIVRFARFWNRHLLYGGIERSRFPPTRSHPD